MLAGHGYRLVLANIRGSDTHGAAWIKALDGRWGKADAADINAVLDASWPVAWPIRSGWA